MTPRHLGWVTEWEMVLTTETEIQEGGRDWEQRVWVSGLDTLSRSACGISWGHLDLWILRSEQKSVWRRG